MVSGERDDSKEAARKIYRETAASQRVPSGKLLGGILLLLIGLVCLAFTAIQLANDLSLWVFGTEVEAVVVDLWTEAVGEPRGGTQDFRYYVQYQFTTPKGQQITDTSTVGPSEWIGLGSGSVRASRAMGGDSQQAPVYHEQSGVPQEGIGGLEEGGTVAVVYFAPYPQHNRLEESRYIPVLACGYVPLIGTSVVGLLLGWRAVRPALRKEARA